MVIGFVVANIENSKNKKEGVVRSKKVNDFTF